MPLSSHYPATTLTKNKKKWYVFCTIPEELRSEFGDRKQIKRSTGTSDKAEASRRQHSIATDIYAEFDSKKPNPVDDLSNLIQFPDHVVDKIAEQAEEGQPTDLSADLIKMLRQVAEVQIVSSDRYIGQNPDGSFIPSDKPQKAREALTIIDSLTTTTTDASGSPKLSVVQGEYLDSKPYGPAKTIRDAELSIAEFQAFSGDIPLSDVTAVMIHSYAEKVGETKSRETIAKKIGYVKRMFDWAIRKGYVETNVFMTITLDKKLGKARASYQPFSHDELTKIFELEMPEHLKTLLSILVTTGMRLDEAALLDWDNIKDDHFDLTTSIVKTKGSARKVPIPKAIKHLFTPRSSGQLFPEFRRDKDGKAQSPASKALMKQIRKVTDDRLKVVHSLRGNLKDVLRDAGVSKEVNDFITGHSSGDVAGTYGTGPSLEVRREALDSVEHPWLFAE
ncbi:MAG: DUF6538 domain-containing protein [Roseobacter sp.]|uniref:DUF6538 domain-containing protein n=1 Tax=Tateyamaria sp. TaxID=1929288 RepID=UPI00326A2C6E